MNFQCLMILKVFKLKIILETLELEIFEFLTIIYFLFLIFFSSKIV